VQNIGPNTVVKFLKPGLNVYMSTTLNAATESEKRPAGQPDAVPTYLGMHIPFDESIYSTQKERLKKYGEPLIINLSIVTFMSLKIRRTGGFTLGRKKE
jgi:hypothetical protein